MKARSIIGQATSGQLNPSLDVGPPRKKRTALSSKQADKIFADVVSCKPYIAASDVEKVADLVLSKELMHRPWRLAAVLAGKDGTFFKDASENQETAELLSSTIGCLEECEKRLRTMADVLQVARNRVYVACCGFKDFPDWVEKGAA